jgi:hypothetical protein
MVDSSQQSLLPDRHPVPDFFVPDIFDSLSFKDDMASMEYPIFSLSMKADIRELTYTQGDNTLNIIPSSLGLPTILDKDILLYCGSLLMTEVNEGRVPPKTLRISSHSFLLATNRAVQGSSYEFLNKALKRLAGVLITTNIKTNKREVTSGFGLVESYKVVESSRVKDRMVRLEITLSDWFYNSIIGKEVLTINKDYFRLRKPLERRLYEIARKHCGRNAEWSIGLDKLKDKTGSTSSINKFRFFIKEQAESDHLPDYRIALSQNGIVNFKRRKAIPAVGIDNIPGIKPETIAKGQKIVEESGTGWDYYEIRSQYTKQLINGFDPKTVDGAFIGFVKDKVSKQA